MLTADTLMVATEKLMIKDMLLDSNFRELMFVSKSCCPVMGFCFVFQKSGV